MIDSHGERYVVFGENMALSLSLNGHLPLLGWCCFPVPRSVGGAVFLRSSIFHCGRGAAFLRSLFLGGAAWPPPPYGGAVLFLHLGGGGFSFPKGNLRQHLQHLLGFNDMT